METVDKILKKYISEKIPAKATNIFFQMFNGINAVFTLLEYRLDIFKRERNILTAQSLNSLRSLAAENGFEPTLKIPAKGLLNIKINSKLFGKTGYPLFLLPYSVFTNKLTKQTYYYNSDKALKLTSLNTNIPVVEGELKSLNVLSTGNFIERFYLEDDNIAQGSIIIESNGIYFQEVKSFYDNQNVNNNKQFVVKFSNNIQTPIIIYIKGSLLNDSLNVTYRLCSGEFGNIYGTNEFEIQNIVDNNGNIVDISDDEITITNYSGFDFGSNGTDENSLRAAIGYNHGKTLLFDNTSYVNFLGKYSTILIQKITNNPTEKTINNIFITKKQSITESLDYVSQYKSIILTQSYFFNSVQKTNLSKIIEEFEYALTSSNIYNSDVCKFAFQINFDTIDNLDLYSDELNKLLYLEFSKFLHSKSYILNIETLFETFMKKNNIVFEYTIFNQIIEAEKILKKVELSTPYIIKHDNNLPLLSGDFEICDSSFAPIKLFFDVNLISK